MSYFISLQTLATAKTEIVNKITNEHEWKDDCIKVYNYINTDSGLTYSLSEFTMTIFDTIEVTKKGWIYNSTEIKTKPLYILTLVKVHDIEMVDKKVLVSTESQYETPIDTPTHLEPIPETEETEDQPVIEEVTSESYDSESSFESNLQLNYSENEPLLYEYQHDYEHERETEFDTQYYEHFRPSYPPGLEQFYPQCYTPQAYHYTPQAYTPPQSYPPQVQPPVYSNNPFVSIYIDEPPVSKDLVCELKDRLFQPNYGLKSSYLKLD
jgi:hypothetical protein